MARILILQETPGPLDALRKSLEANHELYFAGDVSSALGLLPLMHFDLIITRMHLETANAFEFLHALKIEERYHDIPIVCFCGSRTALANSLDESLAHSVEIFGARRYICIDRFCVDDHCDYQALRYEIESCMSAR